LPWKMSSVGSEVQPVSCRKMLVAKLKERNGILPSDWNTSRASMSVVLLLPVTCAFIPKDVCIATGIFSCHHCDMYRAVMQDNGTYKGKSQQQFGKTYKCLYPNRMVVLCRPPDLVAHSPASTMGREEEEESSEPQGSSQQSSSLSSLGSSTTRQSNLVMLFLILTRKTKALIISTG
jgi:hypothetical protein